MPTYEYECKKTGKHFQVFQGILDAPVKKCPECGGPVQRLFGTGGGVVMKSATSGARPHCGADTPCCGRDAACDSCSLAE